MDPAGPTASSELAVPMEQDIRSDLPPWMTAVARAFQRDLPPLETAEAVEDAEAPTSPAVEVKEKIRRENHKRRTVAARAAPSMIPGVRSADRRRGPAGTGLAAFFWDGDVPKAHVVRDISRRGVFVESEFLWPRGTMIVLTLQIGGKSPEGKGPRDAIAIPAEVVRSDPGGMGAGRFLFPRVEDMRVFLRFLLPLETGFYVVKKGLRDRGRAVKSPKNRLPAATVFSDSCMP